MPTTHLTTTATLLLALLGAAATTETGTGDEKAATVKGLVRFDDGRPAGFVDVFLESVGGTYQGAALTDEEGRYLFRPVPPGHYRLYAHAAGYRSTVFEGVTVTPGSAKEYTITLSPEDGFLEEMTIDARLLELVETKRTGAPGSLEQEFVQDLPLQRKRVQDIVALFPGVTRAGSADSSDLSIAGGSTSQIGYRLDGCSVAGPVLADGSRLQRHAPPNDREAYTAVEPGDFHDAAANPLSTFAVDVDTASWSNTRRLLREGTWPPAGAVRIEEMLNSFAHDDAGPSGPEPFGVTIETADCPWAPAHRLVRIALKGREAREVEAGPMSLHFLVDVSGSMRPENKLPLVRRSLALLLDRLTARDRVSLTVYAGAAGVVLPPTSGAERARIEAALKNLTAGGSTNGAGGIRAAYRMARESFVRGGVNRVILATDGDFNVGVSSESELVQLIEKERESGVFLTVLGVGTGNYQDSRLEQLADHGNGQFAYLDSLREAEKVLVRNAGGTLLTIAKDAKVQVEMNPARVAAWRLIGYENRELAAEDFADDRKDGGEIGAGHSVIALYEIVPRGGAVPAGRRPEPLRYQQPRLTEAAGSGELLVLRLRWKEPDGERSRLLEIPAGDHGDSLAVARDELRFDAAVAAFGEKLRRSGFADSMSWPELRALAASALGPDPFGDRAELLELIDRAAALEPTAR